MLYRAGLRAEAPPGSAFAKARSKASQRRLIRVAEVADWQTRASDQQHCNIGVTITLSSREGDGRFRATSRTRFFEVGLREPLLCCDCEDFLNETGS